MDLMEADERYTIPISDLALFDALFEHYLGLQF